MNIPEVTLLEGLKRVEVLSYRTCYCKKKKKRQRSLWVTKTFCAPYSRCLPSSHFFLVPITHSVLYCVWYLINWLRTFACLSQHLIKTVIAQDELAWCWAWKQSGLQWHGLIVEGWLRGRCVLPLQGTALLCKWTTYRVFWMLKLFTSPWAAAKQINYSI